MRATGDHGAVSKVDELLSRYITEHRASGDTDPLPYLGEVTGTDRAELAALIDHYLAQAPLPAFDQERFDRFRETPRRSALVERLLAPSLEDLRTRAQLTKQGIGDLLAIELDLTGHEQGLKSRYHDLETGSIAPERVAPRVWTALSKAFVESVVLLKSAVASHQAPAQPEELVAFTRPTETTRDEDQVAAFDDRPGPEKADPVDAAFFQEDHE
jgi:hypothetical protein